MNVEKDPGVVDKHGHWRPTEPLEYEPLFQWPIRPLKILKFLFGWGGYIWPVRVIYAALAYVTWYFLHAGNIALYKTIEWSWIWPMLVRNLGLMVFIYSFYHLTIYVWKLQGTKGKYNPKWQEKHKKFLFGDQVWDNVFRSIITGVPLWTAWEVLYLWMGANGKIRMIEYAEKPVWFIALFFIIPLWREVHFYFVHRLLHWKPLLKAIHSVHHKNPNPGPWSGMSQHPVEHLFYLSTAALHLIVPSHPMHLFFNTQLTALRPAHGHTGFQGPFFKGFWPAGDYFHYLHHKHVNCNFGESVVPLDKWLGRFYNGVGPYNKK